MTGNAHSASKLRVMPAVPNIYKYTVHSYMFLMCTSDVLDFGEGDLIEAPSTPDKNLNRNGVLSQLTYFDALFAK